jgi:hypothetical protein
MKLNVCGKFEVDKFAGADLVLTVQDPGDTPPEIKVGSTHFIATMSDLEDRSVEALKDRTDLAPPTKETVAGLIKILSKMIVMMEKIPDPKVLIHCQAGVSRSPSVAYILLCMMDGAGKEHECFKKVLEIRPTATFNLRIVRLADDILRRGGAMVKEIVSYKERMREESVDREFWLEQQWQAEEQLIKNPEPPEIP